ncbi:MULTISPECIES: glutathione S-transferase family protein [unclassified Hyphomonas]|jgi:glutathione S-transferase|uniref:Glutathione S-transferase, unnamed subgroup n=1 Tax=hydrothermal vent metagenome TaxID=652676 RepID=A0A160TYY6_9ZZZZ|nr:MULTISPECIES: glutathione S-transferase family protein [unclassified Hyphomonas]MAL47494.1 glutathione S-transferase [Hyphomonas sp.]MAX84868.1 glutathione S-transferase [Hyphomonas sp.]HAO34690.1 glutathione S-transferase family protein [Hyphomonas sp.]HBJ39253.1 glutathione S-transferase family protein [Hyphomonas sp.]HBN91164.1 glutathione S-transferase family protein [Hyphomonas sp.]|tara:strand:- start:724 stop:1353 length:630 start_codon:yes stop_codon:yes gene_type:complete
MPHREIQRLTLYGDSISGNCMKPKWTADLLGIPYDWVEVDILQGGTQTEDFLSLNPAGQVPLARWPDGRALPQSNAIMLYLAEEAGSDLVPSDMFRRAQMMSWLFWEQYSHETAIAVRRFQKHYLNTPDDQIDPQLMAKGRRALGVMELQLTYTDWLVGDAMTLADIALVAYTRVAHEGGFDLSDFPSVERWVSRTEVALNLPHAKEAA